MSEELFTPELLEAARLTVARPSSVRVAFAGRSNVGKSSLLNALTGRKELARVSSEPGRTREVNLFLVDERLRLADLPGYGFAKVSRTEAHRFQNLGRDYLRGRVNLKRVYLLIDSRHGLKAVDDEALDALDLSAVSYQIVLTKADKLKRGEAEAVAEATLKKISKRPAAFPRVAVTSSEKGIGIPELRAEVLLATGLAESE
jgi:GTP-binding protein